MPRPYNDVFSDFPKILRSSRNRYLNTTPQYLSRTSHALIRFLLKTFLVVFNSRLIMSYHNSKALKTLLQSMHNNAYYNIK